MGSQYMLKVLDKSSQVLYDIQVQKETLRIGRQHDNDFALDDAKLSRHHAEIRLTPRGLFAVDLNSKNGIHLNGKKVPPGDPGAFLNNGDEIQVGNHRILIQVKKEAPPQASPQAQPLGASLPGAKDPTAMPFGSALDGTMVMSGSMGDEAVFSAANIIKLSRPRLVLSSAKERRRFEIQAIEATVGRAKENNLSIDHPSLSSLHAKLFLRDNKFYIQDMNSTNGVFLNEVRAPEALLENNSYIRFGAVGAIFIEDSPEETRDLTEEELIEKLLVLNKLTSSQGATVREDLEEKGYQVSESMLMRGYCTPSEWYKIYPKALMVKIEGKSKKVSLLLMVLVFIGIAIVALLGVVAWALLFK